jgi:hypothetical protein
LLLVADVDIIIAAVTAIAVVAATFSAIGVVIVCCY